MPDQKPLFWTPRPEKCLSLKILCTTLLQRMLMTVEFCLKQDPSFSGKEVASSGLRYGGDARGRPAPGPALSEQACLSPCKVGVSSVSASQPCEDAAKGYM